MAFRRTRKSKQLEIDGQEALFPAAKFDVGPQIELRPLESQLWTANKAALVARYLYYFVFITHHGTYIDAFAGPQSAEDKKGWTARLVLESQPAWLNKFYFFEIASNQLERLANLQAEHSDRDILLTPGDVNQMVSSVLPPGSLRDKQASFCLLDQRTFECDWRTVEYIAQLKPEGRKIEQFYFLAQGWLDRAFAASTTDEGRATIDRWWGSEEWTALRNMRSMERSNALVARFRSELGYAYSNGWPIFDRDEGGRVMYWMIHASDHYEAPKLMRRAYDWAVRPFPEDVHQLEMEFESIRPGLNDVYGEDEHPGG